MSVMPWYLWVGLFIFIGSVIWRVACLYINVPWPFWLSWVLHNPYMLVFCHPATIVKRMEGSSLADVLEIGCGAGRVLVPFAQLNPNCRFIGLDLQLRMIRKAEKLVKKTKLQNVEILQGDIRHRPFANRSFDLIYMVTVLGEIPARKQVIRDVCRLLKSGGRFSVTEVIPDPCYQTIGSVRRLFDRLGMVEESVEKGLLSYTITFVKN